MKKINYILFLLTVLSLTVVSCKKFLEKEPIGKTGKNTLFETVDGAKLAINGSYNAILSYYKNEFGMYADVTADNLIRGNNTSVMLPQFNFQSSSGDDALAVGHIWLNIFEALNGANNILAAIPDLSAKFPDQSATLDGIKGEALVMRALCHFDLSRAYAQHYNFTPDASHLGVPVLLKTPSPGDPVARKTMKQTYDQIIQDLNDALPLLQKSANHTTQVKITYQAALALLSRVYLYKGDWAQAINYADMVINDNAYKLAAQAEYKSVFLNTPKADANPKIESIFVLTNNGLPNGASSIFATFSDAATAGYLASAKLKSSFGTDNDDIRLTEMFTVPTTGQNAGSSLTKKYAEGIVSSVNPPMIQVIRLSELYLNRAEAKWNLKQYPEAAEDLRIISQRAHPLKTITITYSSNADLYKQIADERNRELCFENHRFFDIARRKENMVRGNDCNSTTCVLNYPNDKFVLPIPVKETDANKALIPNPGFN
jgi:tetratricopeptide (TPR) repeat protein